MGADLIATNLSVAGQLWQFGLQHRTARDTPLQLFATSLGNVAAVQFSTLQLAGAGAGYVVTAAKTLILLRAIFRCDTAAKAFSIGYSDTDLGFNSAADGANPVNLDSASADGLGLLAGLSANVLYDVNVYYEIPAGKYPRIVVPVGVANFYQQFLAVEV